MDNPSITYDLELVCYIDLSDGQVTAYPLDRFKEGTQTRVRGRWAEVWIPHHTADRVYCLTCFLAGKANHEPAPVEMRLLQGAAAQLVAAFGEHARKLEA